MTDQDDFFFDEDETKAGAPEPAASAPSRPAPRSAAPAQSWTNQTVTVPVAALLAVCTLLVGVVVGLVIDTSPNVPAPTQAPVNVQPAPQLSPEQLDDGALPEGHPPIGEVPSEGATGTPEGEAPGSE